MQFLGRSDELEEIGKLIDLARSGRSGALAVRSEAGMGKTSLLDHAVSAAGHVRVERIVGFASESEFGFAALQRLLSPMMGGLQNLPERQRDAIGTAFGQSGVDRPDRYLVGLAALTLIADAADEAPLLLVIDDAQWIDQESFDTLLFIARRLDAESVAMLFALRTGSGQGPSLEGVRVIDIGGLSEPLAEQLLVSTARTSVSPDVAHRIAVATRGCPLAVVELASELTAEHLAGFVALPDPLPIGNRLEKIYAARVDALPANTQLWLLIAAAETDAARVWRAARRLGLSDDSAEPAVAAGLGSFGSAISFRHPLIRSAVYGAATGSDRRRAHAALAAETDDAVDPDGRVRHLAAASIGPNEYVAGELERRSIDARHRGRYSAEAALMSRAAELTPDAASKARRTLAAAESHHAAGARVVAARLLDAVPSDIGDLVQRTHAARLRATIDVHQSPASAVRALLDVAGALESVDRTLARDAYVEALHAALMCAHLLVEPSLADVAHVALETDVARDEGDELQGDSDPGDVVLRALATRMAHSNSEAAPLMRNALDALAQQDLPPSSTQWSGLGGLLAAEMFDVDALRTVIEVRERDERARGAIVALRATLSTGAHAEMWCGRFSRAESMWSEAQELSAAMGEDPSLWEMQKAELFAWQGKEAETRAFTNAAVTSALADAGLGLVINNNLMALNTLELGGSAYDAALAASWPLFERDPFPTGGRVLPDIVEAAQRCGEHDMAVAAHERLAARAAACGTSWAIGLLARSTALMGDDDPEPHFRRSVEVLAHTPLVPDLARTRLVFGEWLRRQNRRVEARAELHAAHEMFATMGAAGFARRAQLELAATGERARKRDVSTTYDLTPRESQVARLAADHETNRQIAAKLFLSSATVDYHLRKVYRKLGVDSRHKLADALRDGQQTEVREWQTSTSLATAAASDVAEH